jgi:hypothetical protein
MFEAEGNRSNRYDSNEDARALAPEFDRQPALRGLLQSMSLQHVTDSTGDEIECVSRRYRNEWSQTDC